MLTPDPDAPIAAAIRRLRARRPGAGMLVVVTGAPDDLHTVHRAGRRRRHRSRWSPAAGTAARVGGAVTVVDGRRRRARRRLEPRHGRGPAPAAGAVPAPHDRRPPARGRGRGARDDSARGAVAALALVSVAAALAFGRVFADGGFVGPLLVAAIVPHAVGWVGRVRDWPLRRTARRSVASRPCSRSSGSARARRPSTASPPPTPSARRPSPRPRLVGVPHRRRAGAADAGRRAPLRARGRRRRGSRPTRSRAAPTPRSPRSVPTLVLFVLTGTLGTDDLRVPTTIAYVAAALVELTIANASRVEARRTWFTGRRLASDASVVRSAAAVGGAALLIGLVITPLVPGVDSRAGAALPQLDRPGRAGSATTRA